MKTLSEPMLIGGAVVLAGGLLWWVMQKGNAASVGNAVGSAAAGAAAGVVTGIGGVVGIPAMDPAKGQAAAAQGDWWTASLYMPAPQFIAAAGGAAQQAVVDAANNPNVNPLQPAGASLGSWLYDVFHPTPAGA